jgi:hypothetical protein
MLIMEAGPRLHTLRKHLSFSVRALILVVLVIGAFVGHVVRGAHAQRDAVAAIEKLGGYVIYNWNWTAEKVVVGGKPWAPAWLVDQVGADYFGHVTCVGCGTTSASDIDRLIEQILNLNRVQHLDFAATPLSDDGLARLTGLTELAVLRLAGTNVTDAGLTELKASKKLSLLNLSHTKTTDAGLAKLTALTELADLDLSNTGITDTGLAQLKGLAKLTTLDLSGVRVTTAGMNALKKALPRLTIIRDYDTRPDAITTESR